MRQLEETRAQLNAMQQANKSSSNDDMVHNASVQNLRAENERLTQLLDKAGAFHHTCLLCVLNKGCVGKEAEEAKAHTRQLGMQVEQFNAKAATTRQNNSPGLEEKVCARLH